MMRARMEDANRTSKRRGVARATLWLTAVAAGALIAIPLGRSLEANATGAAWTAGLALSPDALAVDGQGNVYAADVANHVVVKIDPVTGVQTRVAGTGTKGLPTPGPALSSDLSVPAALVVDDAGNLYIADADDSSVVVKVDTLGQLSIVAGVPGEFRPTHPGPAALSNLAFPSGLTLGGDGSLYIADTGHAVVSKIDTATGNLSIVAGVSSSHGGQRGKSSNSWKAFITGVDDEEAPDDPLLATRSYLNLPFDAAVDSGGNLYIADTGNHVILKVTGGTVSIIAGNGEHGAPYPGEAIWSSLGYVTGLAVDASDNLYLADLSNHMVLKIDPAGNLSIVAGTGNDGAPTEGPALDSDLSSPSDVAVDADGNVYIAASKNHLVLKVDPAGNLSIVAGTGGKSAPTSPTIANIPTPADVDKAFLAEIATNSDGETSLTSSTPDVCTVTTVELGGEVAVTVSLVAAGECALTAAVAEGTFWLPAQGEPQTFTVGSGKAAPTQPTITNLPGNAILGGGFVAVVGTTGDGVKTVTSSTPTVCTVAPDGLTVSFVAVGTCQLKAHVAEGTTHLAAAGQPQSLQVGYVFSGFLSPLTNPPGVNTGKAGRTYPVKFRLTDAQGTAVTAVSAVRSLTVKATSCTSFTTDPTGATAARPTGGTALSYDAKEKHFIFNWATPAKGCHTLFLTLASGQVHHAHLKLN